MSTPKMPKGAKIGDRLTFKDAGWLCAAGHYALTIRRMGNYFADERVYYVCQDCDLEPKPAPDRTGTVIDRAPQGWNNQPGINADTFELSGYWLWVMPDDRRVTDTGSAVRVRFYSRGRDKGKAVRDDGPMCVTGRLAHGHGRGRYNGDHIGGRKVTVQELLAEVTA